MSVSTRAGIPVSVVVMTKDEEANLAECLRSVSRFDEVFVVDSQSRDRTQEIARTMGATVVEFVWNGRYPKKKQWCLDNLSLRNDWVLFVDADEVVTPELADEIATLAGEGFGASGYFVGYDYVFLGRRLRHGLRVYKLVLLDRRRAHFDERDDLDVEHMWEVEGHYQPVVDGVVATLRERMIHDDHAGLYHYFERHNRYSDWEASLRGGAPTGGGETQIVRRSRLKRAFARTPLRPLAIFLYSYIGTGGFLDGRPGFHYAVSRSFYYWQIGLKASARAATNEHPVQHAVPEPCCPVCRRALQWSNGAASCACGAEYSSQDGVPVLVAATSDSSQKQARWFDRETEDEWEIERPNGAPALYSWLMREKFRRSVENLDLPRHSALVVCAGSGMDAEFLARAGASVTALDISPRAVARAAERARRHGFELRTVVGDAARLPFPDASFDVVYVHDGLHHLEDPIAGVAEMARVARVAVCLSEPAQARITAVAVRLGLALDEEEAGNRVGRLDADLVAAELRRHGFVIARNRRYGMYYRHEPGRVMRLLSQRGLIGVAASCFRIGNALAGRFGNKLVVVAVRQ